jgi:hypothetical protein
MLKYTTYTTMTPLLSDGPEIASRSARTELIGRHSAGAATPGSGLRSDQGSNWRSPKGMRRRAHPAFCRKRAAIAVTPPVLDSAEKGEVGCAPHPALSPRPAGAGGGEVRKLAVGVRFGGKRNPLFFSGQPCAKAGIQGVKDGRRGQDLRQDNGVVLAAVEQVERDAAEAVPRGSKARSGARRCRSPSGRIGRAPTTFSSTFSEFDAMADRSLAIFGWI